MCIRDRWKALVEILHLIASDHDTLLAMKLGLIVLFAALSLHRRVRVEDKAFAVMLILQMLMYTGRPLLGAARYLMPAYPAFVMLGSYAERRWNGRLFSFYLCAFGFLNLMWMWAFLNWSLVF